MNVANPNPRERIRVTGHREDAHDLRHIAAACIRRFDVQFRLVEIAEALNNPSERQKWNLKAWHSLRDVLSAEDLHPEATCRLAQEMVGRILGRGDQHDNDLALGDLTYQARRRATELTQRAFHEDKPFGRQIETTSELVRFPSVPAANQWSVSRMVLTIAPGTCSGASSSGAISSR